MSLEELITSSKFMWFLMRNMDGGIMDANRIYFTR